MVWWVSVSRSQELWAGGVCQVRAVDLCLLHCKTLLPETEFQIRLGSDLVCVVLFPLKSSSCIQEVLSNRVNDVWCLCKHLHFHQEPAIYNSYAASTFIPGYFALKKRKKHSSLGRKMCCAKVQRPNKYLKKCLLK